MIEKINKRNENLIINVEQEIQNNLSSSLEPAKNKNDEVLNSFKCHKCKVTFTWENNLKEHIKLDHPKIIQCKDCSEVFDDYWIIAQKRNLHVILAKNHFFLNGD